MYRYRIDDENGILVVEVFGRWTEGLAGRFLQDLVRRAEMMRQRFGRARILVDTRALETPFQELAHCFKNIGRKLTLSQEDRVATLVTSQTRKSRTRQNNPAHSVAAFLSESSALAWLNDFMPVSPSDYPGRLADELSPPGSQEDRGRMSR